MKVLSVPLILCVGVYSLLAQTRAVINGTVIDTSGATVGDAKVQLTAPATGLRREMGTHSNGIYEFPSLPVGTYNISVSKSGIETYLQRLLSLVQLEHDRRPLEVDGFRLRDLSQWTSFTTNTAMNALTPISSVCNSKCDLCFEENAPYAREQSLMSLDEARTRLKYYSPESGRALFPSSRDHMETFVHPKALEIIEIARQREPNKLFWITSNGSFFTDNVVERLAKLKPIIFKLSLNAADPDENRRLMHTGRRTEIALDAPRAAPEIPDTFHGSYRCVAYLEHGEYRIDGTLSGELPSVCNSHSTATHA
ncbi:MAG TPA: carboxypeptidase regulatory-like domain-containing protein [Bryobacteraceae bacterium]|nr:carboxypeptidase regulatory-like domain-containing protein [Bryobacteraceae bacterium]